MAFNRSSGSGFIFGFGVRTNSTIMAHAASTVGCVVAGSSKIAVSASKPADSACAAGTSAPHERADAGKESIPDAVTRGIFGVWGECCCCGYK